MRLAKVTVPTAAGGLELEFDQGRSIVFVGANGAGKTRLGVYLEQRIDQKKVRRLGAHRSLKMSDKLTSISLDRALRGLDTGYPDQGGNRAVHRWGQEPAVALLSDYDFLLQALFAEQNRAAVEHLERHLADASAPPPSTVLSRLKTIWERLLPHRKLRILELAVEVLPPGAVGGGYVGSQMSDGERVIFYLLGHCLIASPDSILIIDEPELHVHKAILGRLWDAIEAERRDCSFIYITHDLDFVVARPTASKLVVRSFSPPERWDVEPVPEDSEIPERVIVELVGSRQPVLFVEGERGSVDPTIYRYVYPTFLVQPIGSCEAVIHAVASFKKNQELHRIGNVRGCIDADAREQGEIDFLATKDINVLPVAEIENVLLLQDVYFQIARSLHFTDDEAVARWQELRTSILRQASNDLEAVSVRYAIRRLDTHLKRLAPSASTVAELTSGFAMLISTVDPGSIAREFRIRLTAAIASKNLYEVLALYDNKGLLSLGARSLGLKSREELTEFVGRLLGNRAGESLLVALQAVFPRLL